MRLIFFLSILSAGLTAGLVWAAPQPAIAPSSWELNFDYHDPQRITLTLSGDDQPTTYWYTLYTITNETDREVGFYPTFHVVTDKLEVIECGYGINPAVYDAIRARHKRAFPFSFDPMKMYGPLNQGQDNARTSIIVFPEFESRVNRFTLFVGGLSGEVAKVPNLTYDRDQPQSEQNPQFFFLRKTLSIEYDLPGDDRTRLSALPVRTRQEWVMR